MTMFFLAGADFEAAVGVLAAAGFFVGVVVAPVRVLMTAAGAEIVDEFGVDFFVVTGVGGGGVGFGAEVATGFVVVV